MLIATKSSNLDITKESDTATLAEKFASFLKRGHVVFFYGEIGVGKTTFIRSVINTFQKNNKIKVTEVPSPTFNIVNEYEINEIIIQHYDFFRLKESNELSNIGFLENYKEVITLVEWPEIINKKPKNTIDLFFKYEENLSKRFITINGMPISNNKWI